MNTLDLAFIVIILNNLLWMVFVYVFTPGAQKERIALPKIKINTNKKLEDPELEDLATGDHSAEEVLASMKTKGIRTEEQ